MKNNKFILPACLAAVLFLAFAGMIVLRTLIPAIVLPPLDIPAIVLVSGLALLLDQLLTGNAPRCYLTLPLFALASFALFPYVAGYATGLPLLRLALIGTATFTVTTVLFTSIKERAASGPSTTVLTPAVGTFGLYLASQIFSGLFL